MLDRKKEDFLCFLHFPSTPHPHLRARAHAPVLDMQGVWREQRPLAQAPSPCLAALSRPRQTAPDTWPHSASDRPV